MPQKNENGKKFHQSPSLSNFQAFYHVSQVTVHWWVVDYQAKSLYYLVYMHFVLCHAASALVDVGSCACVGQKNLHFLFLGIINSYLKKNVSLTRIIYDCSPLFDITIFHIKMSPSLPLPMIMIFISCLPIEVHAYRVNFKTLKSAKFDFSNWILGYICY